LIPRSKRLAGSRAGSQPPSETEEEFEDDLGDDSTSSSDDWTRLELSGKELLARMVSRLRIMEIARWSFHSERHSRQFVEKADRRFQNLWAREQIHAVPWIWIPRPQKNSIVSLMLENPVRCPARVKSSPQMVRPQRG
jgi:hypothetical protein